ncbi:MAG: hypothetical protein M1827_001606 [Pycnora praestabilis]|nr:MAG: hypothetical protein M1827_001606 [Pycnora praestabilis]
MANFRCTRNCFNCPICTAPLSVNALETEDGEYQTNPFILACGYCNWTSLDIGIRFEKPVNITGQLEKIKNGGITVQTQKERERERDKRAKDEEERSRRHQPPGEHPGHLGELDSEEQFSNLKSFYTSQIMETTPNPSMGLGGDYSVGSPGALSRIMGLYTGFGNPGSKKSKEKVSLMREAYGREEGAKVLGNEDEAIIQKMAQLGWDGTTNPEQRTEHNRDTRFLSDVRPIPALLRTKRSKRCKFCRHILVKPEAKVQSTRFKIRLVAVNYIPALSLAMLNPRSSPQLTSLMPRRPTQYLLTLTNPLFETVHITLATPSHTSHRFASKVTILCPQFDISANTDVWDEALAVHSDSPAHHDQKKRWTRRNSDDDGAAVAEAGKVWERRKNWTSVVVEVVPALLQKEDGSDLGEEIDEDEDLLEVPVFVRVEWETEREEGKGDEGKEKEKEKEKRELAYWCVLGFGRILQIEKSVWIAGMGSGLAGSGSAS